MRQLHFNKENLYPSSHNPGSVENVMSPIVSCPFFGLYLNGAFLRPIPIKICLYFLNQIHQLGAVPSGCRGKKKIVSHGLIPKCLRVGIVGNTKHDPKSVAVVLFGTIFSYEKISLDS